MSRLDNLRFLIIGDSLLAESFQEYLQSLQLDVTSFKSLDPFQEASYDVISIFLQDDTIESKSSSIKAASRLCANALITVTVSGEDLLDIQKSADGHNVLGMNLSYPVKASPFMEIVKTELNYDAQVKLLEYIGIEKWKLDPYVCNDISARSYMLAAMTREALNLVDNGYADAESVDRACRNDAGYYMPFTGNFLYMDLMGTMAYSLVMKDLNPELAKDIQLPAWLLDKVEKNEIGMQSNSGMYNYKEGDYEAWNKIVDEFSKDIRQLIDKYKKDYQE